MQVAVIGSGYVGLVAAAGLAEIGHPVVCVDSDREKVAQLERGQATIHEAFLPELLERHRGRGLRFSPDLAAAVRASEIVFIAVGTPSSDSGEADMSFVESVSRAIAGAAEGYKLVVEKSTVPVYTSEWIRRVLGGSGGAEFEVASNPEFLREGSAVTDFLYPDRIVIGADQERAAELLTRLYAPLLDGSYAARADAVPRPAQARVPAQLIVCSAQSAELIKHASNAFLATKISFINAVAALCEAVGADIEQVCRGIGTDARIGEAFLRPGIGYGGSCFPKDLLAFRAVAQECGAPFPLLDEVMRINAEQRQRFLRKLRGALWTLKGKRLAVLGLAFKGGTDDVRESPALEMIRLLLAEGCCIAAYDPAAVSNAAAALEGAGVSFAQDAYAAAEGADALLILTDWEEFARLDLERLRAALKNPVVVDGRNLYPPQVMAGHGLRYYSMGRAEAAPPAQQSAKGSR